MFKNRSHLIAFAFLVALSSLVYICLVSPDNPLMNHFRGKISDQGGKVVVGPYPLESDFKILKDYGVTAIVSLLDPKLPHENTLIDREHALAQKYGIEFHNMPMTSILGQRLGDYDKNAQDAADVVRKTDGRVYLHCYLGVHRTKSVQDYLVKKGAQVDTYLIRQEDRSGDKATFEKARSEFNNGNYKMVVEMMSPLTDAEPEAKVLEAWARYRLNDTAGACPIFEKVIELRPENSEAKVGGGYCALRNGDLALADKHFSAVLAAAPADTQGIVGMGFVRFRQGRKDEAADLMAKALEQDPGNEEARDVLRKIAPARANASSPK
jgi:tetratricopeptide (TPR) repeat protein